jgi:hypothetical protein
MRSAYHHWIYYVDIYGVYSTVPRATVGSIQWRSGDQWNVDIDRMLVGRIIY